MRKLIFICFNSVHSFIFTDEIGSLPCKSIHAAPVTSECAISWRDLNSPGNAGHSSTLFLPVTGKIKRFCMYGKNIGLGVYESKELAIYPTAEFSWQSLTAKIEVLFGHINFSIGLVIPRPMIPYVLAIGVCARLAF